MQHKSLMIINVVPYALFIFFGLANILVEFYFGSDYKGVFTNFLWSYFLFPLIIMGVNFYKLKGMPLLPKIVLCIGSGILFFVMGYILMLLFTSLRIRLGLEI